MEKADKGVDKMNSTVKRIFFLLPGLIFVNVVFSQERIVDRCVDFIGRAVPKGFSMQDRTTYSGNIIDDYGDEHNVQLLVKNGLVYASAYGAIAEYTHEATEWLSQFYVYFENGNWIFSEEDSSREEDVYINGNIYAIIMSPFKRDDGMIVAIIIFTKEEYMDMF